ncbi:hypothetical protein ABPG73_020365 [Tetrahymena malaccensis]
MNFFKQKFINIRQFFSNILRPWSKQYSFTNRRQQAFQYAYSKILQNHAFYRNMLLIGVLSSYYHKQIVQCIEDDQIQRARKTIEIQINKMKKEFGTQMAAFPEIKYTTRGNWYVMEFIVDQRNCDLFQLFITAVTTLEKKDKSVFVFKNMQTAKDGNMLTLQIDFEEKKDNQKGRVYNKGTICVTGEMISDRPGFKFSIEKTEEISEADIEAVINVYRTAIQPQQHSFVKDRMKAAPNQFGSNDPKNQSKPRNQKDQQKERTEAINKLEELGVSVFLPDAKQINLDWDYLAGYEQQKRDIEDTVLLALQYPEIYDQITAATRMKQEPNRPKAVLFEGPPGTGKTTSAKIIAQQVSIPLIYMPLESIMSKYYGEAEKKFADLWEATKMLGKSIIFIDEIDAIAGTRDSEMHEASRRILSTLLRKIDSFESSSDVLLVCATNRKQDLDPAMLSRIDMSIKFEKPDVHSRQAIFKRYAKHLSEDQLRQLAENSENLSGRNISDICKDAERRWASKLIRKLVDQTVPDVDQYIEALHNRKYQNLA